MEDPKEKPKKKSQKAQRERPLTAEQIAEIESLIGADRRHLDEQRDMEVEKRDKIKVHCCTNINIYI